MKAGGDGENLNIHTSALKKGCDKMEIGFTEITFTVAIALLLFGTKSIPKVGKAIGEGLDEFKRAQLGETEEKNDTEKKEEKSEK